MEDNLSNSSLEILYSVSRELAGTLELRIVLSNILTLSTNNLNSERASLVVLDSLGSPIDAAIVYHGTLIPHTVDQLRDVVNSGLAGWVVKNKKPVLIANTLQDERWLVRPNQELVDPGRSALCVPLMAREQLVGVLTIVHREVNFFSEDQFTLQKAIADMAGIAIYNARLFQEVQDAQQRYHDLFEKSFDPVILTLMDGRILEANMKSIAITGLPEKELLGRQILDLLELPHDLKNNLFSKIEKDRSLTLEATLATNSSSKLPLEVNASVIDLQGNRSLQWILHDISERKKLDLLRDDLSAMIYHDLRSPLANIVSSLELIRTAVGDVKDASIEQLFEISNRGVERMQRLISSLLDINRLEAGQPISSKNACLVEKLINEAIDTVSPIAASREITIEKMIFTSLPTIDADEDMIRRVFINLLENAVKFSSPGDKTVIGAKANEAKITVWVEDHGPGIPEEALERIFNKFVRIHGEGFAKGLGLGLAFCRIAVESHGGKIWVENIDSGGSRFILNLPATGSRSSS